MDMAASATGARRPLVAVVDDEDSVRRALLRLLRIADFDAQGFASGEQFLESLQIERPDCVLLDMQMVGLTGYDVQRHLISIGLQIPLIILTAQDEPMPCEPDLTQVVAHLRKPPRMEQLIQAVWLAVGPDCDLRAPLPGIRMPGI